MAGSTNDERRFPMGNQPEMSRETELNSKITRWQVQVNLGKDDAARRTLDEIHLLQWQIGRDR